MLKHDSRKSKVSENDQSQVSAYLKKKPNQNDEQPDLVFFYSDPLVDNIVCPDTKQPIRVSTSLQKLATDIEYRRLVEVLKETRRDFKIHKSAINFESLK